MQDGSFFFTSQECLLVKHFSGLKKKFLRSAQRRSRYDFGGFIGLLVSLQIELGTACGKLFRCSTMAILDAGDSDILSDQQA
jgi:hypothetical protein